MNPLIKEAILAILIAISDSSEASSLSEKEKTLIIQHAAFLYANTHCREQYRLDFSERDAIARQLIGEPDQVALNRYYKQNDDASSLKFLATYSFRKSAFENGKEEFCLSLSKELDWFSQ